MHGPFEAPSRIVVTPSGLMPPLKKEWRETDHETNEKIDAIAEIRSYRCDPPAARRGCLEMPGAKADSIPPACLASGDSRIP